MRSVRDRVHGCEEMEGHAEIVGGASSDYKSKYYRTTHSQHLRVLALLHIYDFIRANDANEAW